MDPEAEVAGVVEKMVARVTAMAGWRPKSKNKKGGLRTFTTRRVGAKVGMVAASFMDSVS